MNEQELRQQIADLNEELEDIVQLIESLKSQLADQPSNDPRWIGPDEYGGYKFKPIEDLRAEMLASGDRGQIYRAMSERYLNKSFLTVLDGRALDDDFVRNFNAAKASMNFLTGASYQTPTSADGAKLINHSVIIRGNKSPHEAREWFEAMWADPEKRETVLRRAKSRMAYLDRAFARREGWPDKIVQFKRDYPHYVPLDTPA